jgi:hypothetical protein
LLAGYSFSAKMGAGCRNLRAQQDRPHYLIPAEDPWWFPDRPEKAAGMPDRPKKSSLFGRKNSLFAKLEKFGRNTLMRSGSRWAIGGSSERFFDLPCISGS